MRGAIYRFCIVCLIAVGAVVAPAHFLPSSRGVDWLLAGACVFAFAYAVFDALRQADTIRKALALREAERAALEAYRRSPFHFDEVMSRLRTLDVLYRTAIHTEDKEGKYRDYEEIERIQRAYPLLHARMAKLCRDAGDEEAFRRHAGVAMKDSVELRLKPPLNYVDDVYAYAVREDARESPRA